MTLSIDAELLRLKEIEERKNKMDDTIEEIENIQYFVSPVWNKMIEYEWIIDGDMMKKYMCCKMDEWLFSPFFGDNSISFHITPRGFDTEFDFQKGKSNLGVQFYNLPRIVESIKAMVEITTNIECDDDGKLFAHTSDDGGYKIGDFCSASKLSVDMIDKHLQNSGKLVFKCKVIIKKVYIIGHILINETDWKRYDILH